MAEVVFGVQLLIKLLDGTELESPLIEVDLLSPSARGGPVGWA